MGTGACLRSADRVVFSWVLEASEKKTEVEIGFGKTDPAKRLITLTHHGWENRADGAEWRGKYDHRRDGASAGSSKPCSRLRRRQLGRVLHAAQCETRAGGPHRRVVEDFPVEEVVIGGHVGGHHLQFIIPRSGYGITLGDFG